MQRLNQGKLVNILIVSAYVALLAVPFQNCSKGGVSSGVGSYGANSVNPALKNGPAPIEIALNQISLMSCPLAGEVTENFDPHTWPFYTLKYGAFDNSIFTGGVVGGIGISKDTMDYLRRTNPTPVPAAIQSFLKSSPYSNAHRLASALILKDRNPALLSDYSESFVHLDTLTSAPMLNYLGAATQLAGDGTVKMSYFPSASSASTRALLGVINFGKSEDDLNLFVSGLNNHYLAIAPVPTQYATEAASIVPHFVSPDSDVTKRIAGKGYSFSIQYGTKTLTSVSEWDLNPKDYLAGNVIPTKTAELSSCFSLMIVRDIDRKAWQPNANITVGAISLTTADFVHPQKLQQFGALREYYFSNQVDANNVYNAIAAKFPLEPPNNGKAGIFYACPSEDPATLDAGKLATLALIRRFLPAEYFDVNLSQGCIVPLQKALNTGSKCYASGDASTAYYIQYLNSFNGYAGLNCGPNFTECPAYVSFCWR